MSKDEKILAIKNVKSPMKNLDDLTQRPTNRFIKLQKLQTCLLPWEKN